jgi:prepilin-type N-terminal cleavage/methylation domain-containing protein
MGTTRAGFTLVELMVVIVISAIASLMAFPQFTRQVNHSRVIQAASVISGDLEMASSMADRERKPVRVTIDPTLMTLTVTDRAAGTQLSKKTFGLNSEYHLTTLNGSTNQFDIFPNGTVSQAVTITFGLGGYNRQITMSRAAQVRLVP